MAWILTVEFPSIRMTHSFNTEVQAENALATFESDGKTTKDGKTYLYQSVTWYGIEEVIPEE